VAGPPDILVRICERRRERFGLGAGQLELPPMGEAGTFQDTGANGFVAALEASRGNAVIAEVKMGSPKLGSLAGSFDPARQAAAYRDAGASALSVVVEPDHFGGSYELLALCREHSGLPAIAKDFVVTIRQLDEAARAGASAVLLIAALYDAETLRRLADSARCRGLAPLIETHDAGDVRKLSQGDWELVGVNNRDLRTFEVDLGHSIDLLPSLPSGAIKVAESGIHDRCDVERLAAAGFDAFLIGESLVKADDPRARLAQLLGEGG
jgi:indole-3-glycerol phosphate synthase